MNTSETFTDAVTLRPADAETLDVAFLATSQPCPWPKAYGGDMVAQAAVAAMRTVQDGKTMHSMHSYFMRPVNVGAHIRYEVELLRDGRGYSTRHVRAFQDGKPVYVCMASFAAGELGGRFQASMPDGIPHPESLPTAEDYLAPKTGGTMTDTSKAYWAGGRSFDMRHVPGPVYLTVEGDTAPSQGVWVRPFDALREVDGLTNEQRDIAALAYVCDYTILEPALRVLGLAWADEGLVTASLDHAMWFHRPVRMTDWLLYAQDAISVEAGRGTAIGRFFTTDGELVATAVQEGMIRATGATS
ncbi:acyl-CoA thioesterase II [Nocardioides sp. S5]|uniref:acyl-CoA thioesterase n=1 Tax=Nocardioides sp. S5 TaxID=2017486 RepID=UPI001A904380|nr:acyl-CoA thioesterase domain-containing protein [Nocardioides sp. S5]QSR29075.1 acyl-CoA thioesterase II [Nocardioides sp. S5]